MKHVQKILVQEVRSNIPMFAGVLLLMLIVVGFDVLSPWPFKLLIDNVLGVDTLTESDLPAWFLSFFHSKYALGLFAIFLYFSSTFLLSIAEYFKSVLAKTAGRRLTADFSRRAFAGLQTMAVGYFNKQKIGDYIYRLSYDTSAVAMFIEDGLLPLCTSFIYLGLTLTIMFLIDVRLTLIALTSLPFLTVGMYYFNKRIEKATQLSERYNSTTFAFVEQALAHLKIIQAFSQEKHDSEGFDRRLETSLRNEFFVSRLDLFLSLIIGGIIATSYSIVFLYGMQAVFAGALTTGLLIVFILYLDNLTNPIINIIYALTAIQQSYVKISRMEEFFSDSTHIPYHAGARVPLPSYDIRFEHVTLISKDGKKMLDDVSFRIEHGKRTAIFGVNGSGKTTVINLLMRFIDKPTSGTIYIGPYPIEEYDVAALRENISYVPQEISLLNESIQQNILFGRPYNSRLMKQATALSEVDSFIHTLPGTFDFQVGEKGLYLSGGQRQRVMLARALMKDKASIFLFDEAFSALDIKTRHAVIRNVYDYTHDKTVILSSNIFDILKDADSVIVLNGGKLLYSGPSEHLPKEVSLERMLQHAELPVAE